jgi:secreted PhoX family phosphatase
MIDRRRFLQCVVAAAAVPTAGAVIQPNKAFSNELQPDPNRLIDLPDGFSYTVVSRQGDSMSDGLTVPGEHDGMAIFAGDDGRLIIICNHELEPISKGGAFADAYLDLPESTKSRLYDRGSDLTPHLGGTTTTIYDPASRKVERQFLSLCGTKYNCSGGKMPWGSWLTCEESFTGVGSAKSKSGIEVTSDQRHGYVFEVPASATELVDAVPLKQMGRFVHEAAAIQESTGIVYLTEDQWHSLFYRFLPKVPGQLQEGGRLQALAIANEPAKNTHNWDRVDIAVDQPLATHWIDLDDVDGDKDDLRLRGASLGAATFARGEGLTVADDSFAFACTIGGPARKGQVFVYEPSPFEGTAQEQESPGHLRLLAEGNEDSIFRNCDNLTQAPWGDLIVCEDTVDTPAACGLVGVRPDGSQYRIANNAYSASEIAGVCFSPDGEIMFVNIQYPGMTLAITGPWPT